MRPKFLPPSLILSSVCPPFPSLHLREDVGGPRCVGTVADLQSDHSRYGLKVRHLGMPLFEHNKNRSIKHIESCRRYPLAIHSLARQTSSTPTATQTGESEGCTLFMTNSGRDPTGPDTHLIDPKGDSNPSEESMTTNNRGVSPPLLWSYLLVVNGTIPLMVGTTLLLSFRQVE